jgi:NitT/TauT family transport system substrate-binding protein
MSMRTMAAIGFAALLAGVATGCGGDDEGGDAGADARQRDRVNFMQPLPKSLAFYPLIVGEELGYFADEGVEVALTVAEGSGGVGLQIGTGRVDIGSAPAPDVLAGLVEGQDWKVVYNYYQGNVFSINVPEDSEIQSVEDLEGKNLGITSQSGGEVGLVAAALNSANLEQDKDVKITVVGEGGPQVARALEDGTIDAFAGAIQDIPALEAAGLALRDITPAQFQPLPSAPLFMRADRFADEEIRDRILRFLRAWAKSTYVGMINSDAVFEMGKKAVPEETANEDFARAFLELAIKLQTPPGDRFGVNDVEAWDTIQGILVAGEVIPREVPPDQFIDESILDEVNDWDRAEVEADVERWVEENQ